MSCHYGPVFAVERNPSFIKNFLTVGDWQAKIWCEECRESPIIWTKEYAIQLTFGCWSTTRASLFFLSRMDGILDVCDVLYKLDGPILSIKVNSRSDAYFKTLLFNITHNSYVSSPITRYCHCVRTETVN